MFTTLVSFIFLCFTTYHSLFVMENNEVGPFKLKKQIEGDLTNGIFPSKRYEDKNGYFVEVQQSFPMQLKTNYDIEAQEVTENNVPMTYVKIDNNALSLLMTSLLGDIEEDAEKKHPNLYYDVKVNTVDNVRTKSETIITCYGENKRYCCFSLESKLLAKYSTYFDPSINKDDRDKIFLHHLNNMEKKAILNIAKNLKVDSIFFNHQFLIVGSHIYDSTGQKIINNQYHIDLYNTIDMLRLDINSNQVWHYLSIDIQKPEKNIETEPLFKLISVNADYYCILQNLKTKHYTYISYLSRLIELDTFCYPKSDLTIDFLFSKPKEIAPEESVAIPNQNKNNNSQTIEPNCNDQKKEPIQNKLEKQLSQPSSINEVKKNNYLHNRYVQIGIGGSAIILFILLYHRCHHKKCPSFLKNVF